MSDMITIGHTVTHYRALRWGKKKKKKKKRERKIVHFPFAILREMR